MEANPNPKRWVKGGPSPNPGGRPKKEYSLTAILREKLMEPGEDERTRGHRIAEKLLQGAEACDPDLIRYVFNRVDGMPRQAIEQTGDAVVVIGVAPRPEPEAETEATIHLTTSVDRSLTSALRVAIEALSNAGDIETIKKISEILEDRDIETLAP